MYSEREAHLTFPVEFSHEGRTAGEVDLGHEQQQEAVEA